MSFWFDLLDVGIGLVLVWVASLWLFRRKYLMPVLPIISLCAGLAVLLVVGFVFMGEHVQRSACRRFGEASNRETKWVIYNAASWECLTPSVDGKWIPTKNLTEFEQRKGRR